MYKFKFDIGDEIRLIKDCRTNYDFKDDRTYATPDEVYVISARGMSKYGSGKVTYSVKGAYIQDPIWIHMEKNFELEPKTWKERLTR